MSWRDSTSGYYSGYNCVWYTVGSTVYFIRKGGVVLICTLEKSLFGLLLQRLSH